MAREVPQASDRELVAKPVEQARADGLELVGENGCWAGRPREVGCR
ncbi:hypothetical protein ACFYOK_31670 [Microbispora bryophytorum]